MAKIDEATLAPEPRNQSRGRFVVQRTKWGTRASAWPRGPGKWKTPGAFYRQQEFASVARGVSNSEPVALASAINIARGSDQVPRDLLMMAAYGLLYDIKFMDGTPVTYYRMVAANAQLTLDQITDKPGAIIYRSPLGWIEILPGNNGDVLFCFSQVPTWAQPSAASGVGIVAPMQGLLAFGTNGVVPANVITGTASILQAGQQIAGIQFWANAAVATSVISAHIYGRTGSLPGPLLINGPQQTGVVQGLNTALFTTPYTIPVTDAYWYGCQVAVAGFNQAAPNAIVYGYNKIQGYPPPDPIGANVQSYANTILKCWPV